MTAGMSPPAADRQLVLFSLHDEQYGLPIASVREIIRYTAPTATAAAGSSIVRGLIALRGRVLPVADLCITLGRPIDISPRSKILVLELSQGVLGLIVDSVDGVVDVAADRIGRVPVPVAHAGLGEEIATIEDRLVTLIEPESALAGVLTPPGARTTEGTPPPTGARTPEEIPAAKTPAAKTTPAKTTAAKTPARRTPTGRTATSKTPTAKTPTAKTPTAKPPARKPATSKTATPAPRTPRAPRTRKPSGSS